MKTDRELDALKVLEALSAVDEELLERSGKPAAQSKNRMTVRRFVQRYAAACAACLCLMVLGAAYFGMSRIRMGSVGKSEGISMNNGGTRSDSAAGEAESDGAMLEGMAGDSCPDNETPVRMEPEWLDEEQLAALSEGPAAQESADKHSDSLRETMQAAPTQEAVEQEAETVPEKYNSAEPGAEAAVPERYSPVETEEAGGDQEGQDSRVYKWSDGEHSLWLRITSTELTSDVLIDAEPPVYTVREEWEKLIPDAGADGYTQFALLYDNGMLAEYCGALEREEIIRLLESLAR